MELLVFGTEGCHLCEDALSLLRSLTVSGDLSIRYIDILDDDELVQQYRYTIPVVKRSDTGTELNWPFDGQQIIELLNS